MPSRPSRPCPKLPAGGSPASKAAGGGGVPASTPSQQVSAPVAAAPANAAVAEPARQAAVPAPQLPPALPPPLLPTAELGAAPTLSAQLLTFGLENCDNDLVNACMKYDKGGSEAKFSDAMLRDALHRLGYYHVDYIVDARRFPDPDGQSRTQHIGINPAIMARISKHAGFPTFMRQWRRDMQTKLDKYRRVFAQQADLGELNHEFVVAVYCKSGKHRSVAVAEMFAFIFREVERFPDVPEVVHLSRARWGRNICKGGCLECKPFSELRQASLQRAADLWRAG
eukprot:TRINITY_DN56118_c0_g4_i2.p2 TRINITY_DN56118_c0_g4~~TRINITY_DN56118_c0_g4_i2.p2  ORF type:complete len:283 (+),score=63.15 TRINITY_DN56118_c0_g4_i2:210-1058(+)